MRWLLGAWIIVVLVAGATAAVGERLGLGDGDPVVARRATTTTTTTVELVPGPNQAFVRGTVTAMAVDGAVIGPVPMPVTVTTPERGFGSGATIEGVTVDGKPASIVWDAGRPLQLSGEGALVPGPVHVDLGTGAIVAVLDGPAHGFAPGAYRIDTTVAVGHAGLASSRDGVTFVASDQSTAVFSGHASVALPARAIDLKGPGRVTLDGTFTVQTPDGTADATHLTFGPGPFVIALTPAGGAYTIDATLQGPISTT